MKVDESLIVKITQEVLSQINAQRMEVGFGDGIFSTMDQAITAAWKAHRELRLLTLHKREEMIKSMRESVYNHAALLAQMAVEESGMGRVADKVLKNQIVAYKTPGTEDLQTQALSGDRGLDAD